MNHQKYGNALVFYGGGLCDCAAFYMAEFCQRIKAQELFDNVYVGFYSFRCLTQIGLIEEWTEELYKKSHSVHGGYFGTARKTDLANDLVLQERAIKTCKELNVKWIFLAGGDGSSRQVAEICNVFAENGIHFCFTMPMTIDGIEGGYALGREAAVAATLKQMAEVTSTTLRTLDGNKYPGVVFELQGRNRDDILAQVLYELTCRVSVNSAGIGDFKLCDVDIIAIPANTEWSVENLKKKLHIDSNPESAEILGKPTVIFLSEGASIKKKEVVELAKAEGKKLRAYEIGHYSQINNCTSDYDKEIITNIIDYSMRVIKDYIESGYGSFTIVYDDDEGAMYVQKPDYFAELNPKEGQIATLPVHLQESIDKYLP